MKRTKVYEITKKKPSFSWQRLTIRHAVYTAMRELKRADVPKVIGAVLAQGGNHTKQKDQDKQIKFTLWQFAREGIVKERPDRRWQPRRDVLEAMAPPRKRKKRKAQAA